MHHCAATHYESLRLVVAQWWVAGEPGCGRVPYDDPRGRTLPYPGLVCWLCRRLYLLALASCRLSPVLPPLLFAGRLWPWLPPDRSHSLSWYPPRIPGVQTGGQGVYSSPLVTHTCPRGRGGFSSSSPSFLGRVAGPYKVWQLGMRRLQWYGPPRAYTSSSEVGRAKPGPCRRGRRMMR